MTQVTSTEEMNGEPSIPSDTENPTEMVVINNLVVTLLNLENSSPDLAQKSLKLNEQTHKVIIDFFKDHIIQTREGKRTRECKFISEDVAMVSKIKNYTSNKSEDNFVEFSNNVTNFLFRIMKDSNTKSNGSFFILDAIVRGEDTIVLLKLDPKTGVQLDPETLDLNQVQNMLPDSNERVHKCAIIKTNFRENEINLFVMDRQQTAGEPSQYFMQGFLQAHTLPNDSKKTTAVLTECYEKITSALPNLDKKVINEAIDTEFNNGSHVHLTQSIENIYNSLIPDDTPDREIVVEDYKMTFINNFQNKYSDYGLSFIVDRDERKTTYTSKNKQIFFKYDKVLEDNEVIVEENDDCTLITIVNSEEIGFRKLIR